MDTPRTLSFTSAIAWIILGVGTSLFCAEFLAQILPVNMGLYRTQNNSAWPMYGYGPHQRFVYSLGWQMLFPNSGKTNNYGQIAPYDFVPNSKPIAVIGDSFVESQMNPYGQTVQGRLNNLFNGRIPVYGFGFGGNSLAEYLAVGRMAQTEFLPVALVLVIIDNDIKESWQRRIGHRYFKIEEKSVSEEYWPLDRGGFLQQIRTLIGDSALYRYVQVNLGFSLDLLIKKHKAPSAELNEQDDKADSKSRIAVDYFLAHMAKESGMAPDHVVLVFDSDREVIYDPTHSPRKGVDSATVQSYFKEKARVLGYRVVDTGVLFAEHFSKYGQRFDFSPTDRHWDATGHAVVAGHVFGTLDATLCSDDRRLNRSDCDTTSNEPRIKGHLGK